MISVKLVFRSIKGRCHGNQVFGFIHRTGVVHGCGWTQTAVGAAGRANVELCRAFSLCRDVISE